MILTKDSVDSRMCTGDLDLALKCLSVLPPASYFPLFVWLPRPKFLQRSAEVPASCDAGHFETLIPLCELCIMNVNFGALVVRTLMWMLITMYM